MQCPICGNDDGFRTLNRRKLIIYWCCKICWTKTPMTNEEMITEIKKYENKI
jgi:transcription elongation factor Elf1